MSTCTFEQAQQVWNDGFLGYYRDLAMDLSTWLNRCAREDLLPDLSVIAFDGQKPVGFVLSGIRETNGELAIVGSPAGRTVFWLLHNVQKLTVQSVQKLMRMLTRRRVSEEVQQPTMNPTSELGLSKWSCSRCIFMHS